MQTATYERWQHPIVQNPKLLNHHCRQRYAERIAEANAAVVLLLLHTGCPAVAGAAAAVLHSRAAHLNRCDLSSVIAVTTRACLPVAYLCSSRCDDTMAGGGVGRVGVGWREQQPGRQTECR
jgi:hypothetical protein